MYKTESERAAQRKAFKAWYESRGATFNAARRQKYQIDKDRRDKARLQAADYRKTLKDTGKLPALRRGLYTVSHLAAMLRVSAQTLRNWETRGMIPKANQPGKYRSYTPEQARLLLQLIKMPLKTAEDQTKLDNFRSLLFQRWHDLPL